jgi:hypothetical protein
MGKREPQTILKTGERSIHLKLGRERKVNRNSFPISFAPPNFLRHTGSTFQKLSPLRGGRRAADYEPREIFAKCGGD